MFEFADNDLYDQNGLFAREWPHRLVRKYEGDEGNEKNIDEKKEYHASDDLPEVVDDHVNGKERQLKRLKADFDNYRRRVEQERDQQARCAGKDLIIKLLPVLDDFNYALASFTDDVARDDWHAGVLLIKDKMMSILEDEGLSRIDAKGRSFDPRQHDAVFCDDDSDAGQCVVKEIIKDGYMLGDEVIRPAQVIVSN